MTVERHAVSSIAARSVWVGDMFMPATVHVRDGVIDQIDLYDADADLVVDADAVLLPGLVDSHVHLNAPVEPGGRGSAPERLRPSPGV